MIELTETVVTRWVRAPRQHVETVLADRGFQRRGAGDAWTARGRLPGSGERVELEVLMWCDDTAEINVRPAARRPLGLSMSRRYERRYFDDAHLAAAELAAAAA